PPTVELSFYVNGPGAYPHVDPSHSLPIIAAGGFRAVDVSASAGARVVDAGAFSDDARKSFLRIAQSAGLQIAAVVEHPGLATTISEGRPLELASAIRVAVDLHAPLVAFHIGTVPPGVDRDLLWRSTIAAVREAATTARAAAVDLVVDAVAPDFLTRTPEELRQFLEEVDRPAFGWNFDPAFVAANGWSMHDVIQLLAPWIRHVHVKDYRGRYPDQDWLIPGDGALDHKAYIAHLREVGYARFVSVEVIARRGPDLTQRWPIEHAVASSYATLSAAL